MLSKKTLFRPSFLPLVFFDPLFLVDFWLIFSGLSSVTLFSADTGGNFSAVGGFLFFGGNDFGEGGITKIW